MTLQIELSGPVKQRLYASTLKMIFSVPIMKAAPYKPVVAMSTEISEIRFGTELLAFAEYVCTTPYTYNVMIGSYMILANGPSDINGLIVAPMQPMNFNKTEHHWRDTRAGWWVGWSDVLPLYLNLVLYSAASNAQTGHKLSFDSGNLWAKVTAPL